MRFGVLAMEQKIFFYLGNKTENLQLRCCKWILNVSRTCTNVGALGELGRYPMLQSVIINVIKYWMHLESLPEERLLSKVYKYAKEKKLKWFIYVTECLKLLNIDINTISLSDSLSKDKFLVQVKEKLNELFNSKWNEIITQGPNPKKHNSKLRTFGTFKNKISLEQYLSGMSSIKKREHFTKLRLSEHKLAIETDRRRGIKLEDRICSQCRNPNHVIEDEFHFIIDCDKYKENRAHLFKSIDNTNKTFKILSSKEKFTYIMSYKTNIEDILQFVDVAFKLRTEPGTNISNS